MQIIKICPGDIINIGCEGEHKARQVQFDISGWVSLYGKGVAELIYKRVGDASPYPVAVERQGSLVLWTITSTDTAKPGRYGHAELRYYVEDTLVKSATSLIYVYDALNAFGKIPDPPGKTWLDQALQASVQTQIKAQAAERALQKSEEAAKQAVEKSQAAAQSEEHAGASEKAAEVAQKRAEDAQSAAESAQKAAEKCKTDVDNSASAAEAAARSAEESAGAAERALQKSEEAAKQAVEESQTAAQSKERAIASEKAAEVAQKQAEDAQSAAEAARKQAEDAQSAAEAAQKQAEDAQSAAEAAQKQAEDAQSAAESAQKAAEECKTDVDNSASAADAAARSAEESAGDAAASQQAAALSAEKAAESREASAQDAMASSENASIASACRTDAEVAAQEAAASAEQARLSAEKALRAEHSDLAQNDPTQPDYVKNRTHWVESTREILSDFTSAFATGTITPLGEAVLPVIPDIVEGETYIVVWDGVEYKCVCKRIEGDLGGMYMSSLVLGNASIFEYPDTGEPFIVGAIESPMSVGLAISLLDYGTHTVSIVGGGVIHKLDNKYLDLEWLPVKNKASRTILPETNCVFGSWSDSGDFYTASFAIASTIPLVAGNLYSVSWDGVIYDCIATMEEEEGLVYCRLGNYHLYSRSGVDSGEPFCLLALENFGAIFHTAKIESGTTEEHHIASIHETVLVPDKLPEKFLPAAVPVIPSATVGQTIVVRAVDENGVPTQWEAVDLLTEEDKQMIVDRVLAALSA